VATVGEAPLSRRVVAGVVFGYAVVLSVVAVAHIVRRIGEVEESPIGLAVAHGDEVPFRGFENVFGPLLLTAILVVATTIRTATLADLSTVLIWIPISIVTNFPLMSAFWIYVVLLLGLGRLGRRKLSLPAFPQDPSLGLASVGRLAYTAFWIYTAASVPILLVNAGDPTRLTMSLAFFLTGLAVFFVSLWGLHTQLVHARREQIDHARRMFCGGLRADAIGVTRGARALFGGDFRRECHRGTCVVHTALAIRRPSLQTDYSRDRHGRDFHSNRDRVSADLRESGLLTAISHSRWRARRDSNPRPSD
jgi:hypothetical protein